jgi:arginase
MRQIKVLGIPFDFGQDHSGVRLAYSAFMKLGLMNRLEEIAPTSDLGELTFPEKQKSDTVLIKSSLEASLINHKISQRITKEALEEDFLICLGGDHGMSLGTIHGLLHHRPDTIVVWADAHGDINTPESSPSGNFHGMPLAFLLNLAKHHDFDWIKQRLPAERLILIGPRDLDKGELDIIKRCSIQYYSSDDLNRIGAKEVIEMAVHKADPMGKKNIHLSFDVDFFDHLDIQSTGTRVKDGPKLEEVFLLGGALAQTGRLKSMDLVEYNPLIGEESDAIKSGELILDFLDAVLKEVFADSLATWSSSKALLERMMNANIFQKENL